MADIEKVVKGLKYCIADEYCDDCPYTDDCFELDDKPYGEKLMSDALELLKEQDAMNVDAFVQWCIDSHIMGDATVRGIKYWIGKYKEYKEIKGGR